MLCQLLSHDKVEITPYVNGTLYSIVSVAEIREEALAMDLENVLNQCMSEDHPENSRQIKMIIKELNNKERPEDVRMFCCFGNFCFIV